MNQESPDGKSIRRMKMEYEKETVLANRLLESLTIANGWHILTPRLLSAVHGHYQKMKALYDLFSTLSEGSTPQQRAFKNQLLEKKAELERIRIEFEKTLAECDRAQELESLAMRRIELEKIIDSLKKETD